MAGQGRAGQGRAGQGWPGQGRAGLAWAGQGKPLDIDISNTSSDNGADSQVSGPIWDLDNKAGQGRAGQGRAGQERKNYVYINLGFYCQLTKILFVKIKAGQGW